MFVHIALFTWKSGISEEDVEQAFSEVRALKEKVTGLIDIKCGANFSPWSAGFTHAVIVLAQSKEAIQQYRDHPAHVIVAQKIEAMEEKSLGIDFEDTTKN